MPLWYGVTAIVWGTFAHGVRVWRRKPNDESERANCIALLALGLVLTVVTPPAAELLEAITGVPNVGTLVALDAAVVGAWGFQPLMWRMLQLPRGRRGLRSSGRLAAAVVLGVTALFLLSDVDAARSKALNAEQGAAPFVAEFTVLAVGYVAWMLWQVVTAHVEVLKNLAARGTAEPTIAMMQLRVRVMAVGWILMTAATAYIGAQAILLRLSVLSPGSERWYLYLAAPGIAIIMSGGLFDAHVWLTRRRTVRKLLPLQRALIRATGTQQVGIEANVLGTGRVNSALRQQVTDIFDAEVELRRYSEADVAAEAEARCQAAGIEGVHAQAIVDAASLAVAVHAAKAGREATQPRRTLSAARDGDEVEYLVHVANAYEQSDLVSCVVRDYAAGPPTLPSRQPVGRA